MNIGRDKCEILKRIRKDIAERYGLDYTPSECTNEGNCSGTCPKCDSELQELQRQLDAHGIKDINLLNVELEMIEENGDMNILEGDVAVTPDDETVEVTMGMPAPPYTQWEKKRVLYKECQIAGITFHDLKDVWDELYEGAELALIRQKNNKYDKNAIAVALSDDYDGDPDNFDFDNILGYVPRTENKYLATMLDLGWAGAFECELSEINGSNPYKGSLYMKIYMVSKDEMEVTESANSIRMLELDQEEFEKFESDIEQQGCTYFRYGGFPPWEHKYPKKGEKMVFMYRTDKYSYLYLMHCMAVGDEDAAYFVEDKEMLFAVDDRCFYVFTNIKGPVKVLNEKLDFLSSEIINHYEPEEFLSESASHLLKELFDLKK